MDRDPNAPPLNPLPWIVWALALPLVAVELWLALVRAGIAGGTMAGTDRRLELATDLAFKPDLLLHAWQSGQWAPEALWRLVSYVFVQPSVSSALFVVVLLLALGKMVAEVFRWWAVTLIFFGAAAVGAAVYAWAVPGIKLGLIGGFPAVYGLIGAFTYVLWLRQRATGGNPLRAFAMIGFLMGARALFGLFEDVGWDWVAELAGFATGFLASFLLVPGGARRLLRSIRAR